MIDILFSHHLYATIFYQIKPFTNSYTAHLQKSEPMIYKKSINEKRISQQCNSLNYAVNFLHCWRYYRPLACHFFIVHLVVLENLRLIILKRSFFNLELVLCSYDFQFFHIGLAVTWYFHSTLVLKNGLKAWKIKEALTCQYRTAINHIFKYN